MSNSFAIYGSLALFKEGKLPNVFATFKSLQFLHNLEFYRIIFIYKFLVSLATFKFVLFIHNFCLK